MVAGALATGAAVRSLAGRRRTAVMSEVIAAVLVLVFLVSGFEVTERLIVCPPQPARRAAAGLVSYWAGTPGNASTASCTCTLASAIPAAARSIRTGT